MVEHGCFRQHVSSAHQLYCRAALDQRREEFHVGFANQPTEFGLAAEQ